MSGVRLSTTIGAGMKSLSSIPGPPSLPLVGSCLQYKGLGKRTKEQYHLALGDMYRKYGPLVKERLGGKNIIHVFCPEDIKTVYSVEGKWPVIPPLQETTAMYRAQKEMSLGLGNTNGEEWYRLRSNCQQRMLRPKEVSIHLPSVDSIAGDLVKRLEENRNPTDINRLVGRWSLENAGSLVFDTRLGCLRQSGEGVEWAHEMVELNREIFRLSGDLKLSLPVYKWLPKLCPKWKSLVQSEDNFYKSAISLTDEAVLRLKDALETGKELRDNKFYILSYLLSRPALSLKDVTTLCLSMFTDSLSTTTPTLMFNLYCLSVWQEVQEKVANEVKEVLPPPGQIITSSHIARLTYLKAFVKETFRLWPNGTEVSRFCEQDLVLQGYHIPAGTHVDLNPSVHFRDPDIFPEPDIHQPDRWLRDGSGQSVHPYILTPFGHGTRMCAGRRFAEQDLYVVLARIIQKFRLDNPLGSDMGQVYHTLLWPDRSVSLELMERG